jgi:RNA 2',3'-cyclic 3'-phosphodiesterase
MRLFVALEIPEPVRREVRRRVAGLRERLPRARWVDPDVLHLTLLFLGEVAAERVAELAGRLGQAFAAHPPLPLRLAGGGTFPAGRPARVAWVGVAGPPELAPLQAAVARAAGETLEIRETGERPYQPHVTLARCPSPWPRGAAEKFAAAFPGEIGPPFVADRGVLVESRLSPRGPRYRHLAELPLTAASGEEPGTGGEHAVAGEPESSKAASAEEPGTAGERSA